jgi:hypothetical protein
MKQYRITKYDPLNRNDQGHYLYDHWTEFSDIGKTLEGEIVTIEKYLEVEADYINAIIDILKENQIKYLRVVGYEKRGRQQSIKDNKGKWFHRSEFETIDLSEDKKVSIDEIEVICQMMFRYYGHLSLEINKLAFIHYGFDMYVYVGVTNISEGLREKLNQTSIFIEEFQSPYYSENLQYVIQVSAKNSEYVDEEINLTITTENMKSIIGLSEDHPGNVDMPLTPELATKLNFNCDFSTKEYFLSSEIDYN